MARRGVPPAPPGPAETRRRDRITPLSHGDRAFLLLRLTPITGRAVSNLNPPGLVAGGLCLIRLHHDAERHCRGGLALNCNAHPPRRQARLNLALARTPGLAIPAELGQALELSDLSQ